MFDVHGFINKIKKAIPIDDVITILEKLPNDPTLNQISANAGTIGGAVKIALYVIDKVYQVKVPVQNRLSLTLMKILIESAKDSLPYSISNIKMDEIFDTKSENFGNIILELFEPKNDTGTTDIREHPVFQRFRSMMDDGIRNFNKKYKENINVPQFLVEFNSNLLIKLEEEKSKDKDIKNLLHKWKVNKDFQNLMNYLKNARKLFLEPNRIDGKSLSQYFVENNAFTVDKITWGYDEEQIENKEMWDITSFLEGDKSVTVIAAPFGIGKSSLAKKIIYDCASKFIQEPTDSSAFVPVFVPLQFALESTSNENSLETDLREIESYSSNKKNTRILVILDGLDELAENRPVNSLTLYKEIQGIIKDFPNIKFIITTRLEAGFPDRLNIKDTYVRLFTFKEDQIKEFFKLYGLTIDYKSILHILTEKKLGKPLFCWMVSTSYNKSSDNERELLLGGSDLYAESSYFGEIFLYQLFIHNVILGKPKYVAQEDYN